jgi:hypothetical protein
MLYEYPQEFVDSIMKLSRSNRPSSDTIYQGSVIIPYVKGISKKFRHIGNHFNIRTIFKTKHTLCVTLTKIGLVRGAQQMKQCVYNISCDCGRCYISETTRPLEFHIKEHKYNLTQGLHEKSKLAEHVYEEGQKIGWNEAKVLKIEPSTRYRKYKESTHMSLIDHPISQSSLDISPIGLPLSQQKSKSYNSIQCRLYMKTVFVVVPYRKFVSLVMASILIVL